MHWKTNVGRLHNLHVSTNTEFEICRDLYNIPFECIFTNFLMCWAACVMPHRTYIVGRFSEF